jgi:nicotinamidase/pyrazinamidase
MKTAFFDVDTQIDFLYPAGALYVPGAERIVPAVAALNRYAAAHAIPVVSSMDAHAENDAEFAAWPPHCVAGTAGQAKPAATLLEKGAQQIFVEKQTVNVFETASIGDVLARLDADRYVVYGVVTEVCVLHAARGLLAAGKRVEIVTDAIQGLTPENSAAALAELQSSGATLTTTSEICR